MAATTVSPHGIVRVPHWHLTPPGTASGIGSVADRGPVAVPDARQRFALGGLSRSLHFLRHQGDVLFADAVRAGERDDGVLRYALRGAPRPIAVLYRPDHIKQLMTADEAITPSSTRLSPLAPIVGPDSVLTAVGERHRQQRALLLPRFHGKAVAAYQASIERATEAGLRAWPTGTPVPLTGIAQQITLEVIMSAIFGIADPSEVTPAEKSMGAAILRLMRLSSTPLGTMTQVINMRSSRPLGLLKLTLALVDRTIYRVLAERRAAGDHDSRDDIMALLLSAQTADGEPLSDSEIRDELMTLLLAGHETTSNTVAWMFERLTRNPAVYAQAREAARDGDDAYIEALVNETMRVRPVVPFVGRELLAPFDFGGHRVPAGHTALVSILLLHHRDDLYAQPFDFRPERFLGVRPNPHELMPFGGGVRRCLGAPLAVAELQTVAREILRRVQLRTHDRPGETPRYSNVTMIPARGGLVYAESID
ncbi:putative cytochrome P450 [Gordonia hirsuta DSM 44140 = NBRC 16056]|uniref:Putative cytochrome P450 n=1 Tax=Gordonia hirsuta DSM 44140 = NBRC 16056 TaxID=1121927 RepID=L7LAF3_9ACTN|nr:cytochrome P450 [Gordonia hirsuta]GAC57032.1 putative cytochrome P450 [Gordonia hirsuta DSM 44140 = NBRC 16056]